MDERWRRRKLCRRCFRKRAGRMFPEEPTRQGGLGTTCHDCLAGVPFDREYADRMRIVTRGASHPTPRKPARPVPRPAGPTPQQRAAADAYEAARTAATGLASPESRAAFRAAMERLGRLLRIDREFTHRGVLYRWSRDQDGVVRTVARPVTAAATSSRRCYRTPRQWGPAPNVA